MPAARSVLCCLLAMAYLPRLDAGEVTGDRAAYQLVRDVQAANATAFPVGSAAFRAVHQYYSTAPNRPRALTSDTSAGTVVWNDNESYWSFRETFAVQSPAEVWEPRQPSRSFQRIFGRQGTIEYSDYVDDEGQTFRLAQCKHGAVAKTMDELAVLPQQVWYGAGPPFVGRQWHTMFDPEFNPGGIKQRVIERPDADRILVKLVTASGQEIEVVSSLAAGGNVVRYYCPERRDAPPGIVSTGESETFEWEPLPDGRFRLKRLESTITDARGEFERSYLLEISNFNPRPTIPAGRFRFESIPLPDGTIVSDERNGQRTVTTLGKVPKTIGVSQDRLNKLSELIRQQGFAAPAP